MKLDPLLWRQAWRRQFGDELLAVALDRSLALAKVDHVAEVVRYDLDVHEVGRQNQPLQKQTAVAKDQLRLGGGNAQLLFQHLRTTHHPRGAAAAAATWLDDQRIAQFLRFGQGNVTIACAERHRRMDRDSKASGLGLSEHGDLVAQDFHHLGGRADKHDASFLTGSNEFGVFRKKAIPRMDGLCPSLFGNP